MLKRALEKEKITNQDILEESLVFEQDSESERIQLQNSVKTLQNANEHINEELRTREEVIRILTSDCEDLKYKLLETQNKLTSTMEKELFKTPKKVCKRRIHSVWDPDIENTNRFAPLSADETTTVPATTIQVRALVHNPGSGERGNATHFLPQPSTRMKKEGQILVLADSHGKELCHHIEESINNFSVTVLSKPGAKLKHIVKEGYNMAKHLSNSDWVIVLGGTNDMGQYEPGQLTVNQGMKTLLSWNIRANIAVMNIPYRYDLPSLNKNIDFMNTRIKQMIKSQCATKEFFSLNINDSLNRGHYTRHGLHFNKAGKRLIGLKISDFIKSNISLPPPQYSQKKKKTYTNASLPLSSHPTPDPSYDKIEPFPVSQLEYTTSPAQRQPLGVSISYLESSTSDDPFSLSLDDFPTLPPSPGAPHLRSKALLDHFLEVESCCPVIK